MNGAPALAAFAGAWTIRRRIVDRATGRTGTLDGTARFDADGDGLRYSEAGTLRLPGTPPLAARQTYLWRADGDGIVVTFADGRPFHAFAATSGLARAVHDCPPDTYRVAYDFTAWPDWTSTWRVTGPRKDHTIATRYARDAPG